MPGPRPAPVALTAEERQALEALVRRRTAPQQVATRARVVLLAGEGLDNSAIARALDLDVDTVRLWRGRWLEAAGAALADLSVAERLADAPRPGRPARITAERFCRLVALACEAPGASGRPISKWTGRDLAEEAVARGIVDALSPRHAARLLKRGTSSPTACATG